MHRSILLGVRALALFLLFAPASPAQGTTLGFAEDFALAPDRQAVLAKLVPGSEEYYYFRCLERQHAGAYDEVPALLSLWRNRHGASQRLVEIEHRQALLTFDEKPADTYWFLRGQLGLRFDSERQSAAAERELPTRLDPGLLTPARLLARALQKHPNSLAGLRDSALPAFARQDLDADRLHQLLERLERPDLPNLPALVLRDLDHRQSRGFSSLPIHRALLLNQLEELVARRPALLDDPDFVGIYLIKLAPSPDRQWQEDPVLREAYLERLWSFAQRLSPAHNSLKAHVLHHRLWHDLRAGKPDKQRFMTYLRLPRRAPYRSTKYLQSLPRDQRLVDPSQKFVTQLGTMDDDEDLVRTYLQHFFAKEDDFSPYAEFLAEDWLQRLFAETKLLLGQGDPERWYSSLDPSYVEQLRRRVEIDFAVTQPTRYRADDPVSIDVDLKNVDKLLIKVFEIDTFAFERDHGKEVDASIDLDGIVANEERVFSYSENPLHRVRRHFDFPALSRPGTYVVEFVGNGISSRAVIRKGQLRYVARTVASGQLLTVLNEAGAIVTDAAAWCGGQLYAADERGRILLPFSPEGRGMPLILKHERLTSLETIDRLQEDYALSAGVFVQREALLPPFEARLIVRPVLTLQGETIALSRLQRPELVITAINEHETPSSVTVRDPELHGDAEFVHTFKVPEGLCSLRVVLRGTVENSSQAKEVELASEASTFVLNGIESTTATRSLLLGRNTGGYFLEARGRNGETCPDLAVSMTLLHRDYTDPIEVQLATDARGRIELGELPGIYALSAPQAHGEWELPEARTTYEEVVTGVAGETLRIPVPTAGQESRGRVSLLETANDSFVRDASEHAAWTAGFVELRDLPAGDYDLWVPGSAIHVLVRITAGQIQSGWAVGRDRLLQLSGRDPLQIIGLDLQAEELRIQLQGASETARVHVFATRWLPTYDAYRSLLAPNPPLHGPVTIPHPATHYHAGREIGDEYRYILARRYEKQYPGNMLARPGLLLNPWQIDSSDATRAFRGSGSRDFIGRGGGAGGRFGGRGRGGAAAPSGHPGFFADIDFLPAPSQLLTNLRPDADGMLRVPLDALGQGQHIHVVATDARHTATRSLVRAEQPLAPRRRTLPRGLDPDRHYTEQREIEFLPAGAKATVDDVTTAELETYGSLGEVFQLLRTLSQDPGLARFEFLMRWPSLSAEEKQQRYSEHACHEVHLFLFLKDREFFDQVIEPYLQNKLHKTFLDHWLLEDELRGYTEPWAFAQLNIVEQILLAERLPDQRAAIQRRVRELHALLPPDEQSEDRLFTAALAGRALQSTGRDVSALTEELKQKLAERAEEFRSEEPEMEEEPVPEAAPPAPRKSERKESSRSKGVHEEYDAVKPRPVYRDPGRTREYAENNYWHVPIAQQDAALITVNGFWRDFALKPAGVPFGSPHIAEATDNLSEMLLALAVLDLPFEKQAPQLQHSEARLELQADSALLLVKKELLPTERRKEPSPVLVSQNFVRLDDRHRYEDGQRLEKYVTDEFLAQIAYGCQVVLTNPSSAPHKLDLLLQIPQGAVPLNAGFYTRGTSVRLDPFETHSVTYSFYFPAAGDFPHFPAHVAQDGQLVAFAVPAVLNVVTTPSVIDRASWQHVSQDGTLEELLRFLDEQNMRQLDLSKIAWRMRNEQSYAAILNKLREQMVFDEQLWSFGILHHDVQTVREYLHHQRAFLHRCGSYLEAPLCSIDPIERHTFQLIEFEPLFHARAHRFGGERRILNDNLAHQYEQLIDILCHKRVLDSEDWLVVTYYLLLQDRIEEGLAAFARVDAKAVPSRIQYDYLRCYLDFYTGAPRIARGIAEPYRNHPVDRWRRMFQDVLNQLDEAEGKAVQTSDPRDRTQSQTQLAATEPGLELDVEAGRVTIRYQNLARCEVRYYELDAEFSFSAQPFGKQGARGASYVRPNRAESVALPAGKSEVGFALPDDYQHTNVRVEVVAAGLSRQRTQLSNSLSVQIIESYGQLQVRQAEKGTLMPKVYVKVYARMPGGQVRFHKDGYTDLRGRFDYASVSEEDTRGAERYAILVLSENDGALIREVTPPGR